MKMRGIVVGLLGFISTLAFADQPIVTGAYIPNGNSLNPIGVGTCDYLASGGVVGQCLTPTSNGNGNCRIRRMSDNPIAYYRDCTPDYNTVTNSASQHGPVLVVYPVFNKSTNSSTQPLALHACLMAPERSHMVYIPAVTRLTTDNGEEIPLNFRIAPCTRIGEIPLLQSAYRGPSSHQMIFTCSIVAFEAPSDRPTIELNAKNDLSLNTDRSLYAECPFA